MKGEINMSNRIGIVLDPGHVEGYNVGYNKVYAEGTKMFTLAYLLKEELEKYDKFEVYVTRKTLLEDPELHLRGKMASDTKSNVFISLHSNAYANSTAVGSIIFRSLKLKNSETLGNKLLDAIVDVMKDGCPNTFSRGVQTRIYSDSKPTTDYYGVIRGSVSYEWKPEYSYIIEHGFHTNPDECDWLTDDSNLKKLAVAEAKVLADYFDAKLKIEASNNEKTNTNPIRYNTIEELPDWAKEHIMKLVNKGYLKGDSANNLNLDLSYDMVRMLTILSRAGVFDK